jgi:hypothetical protein
LTVLAPDGVYSDSVIWRQQIGGVLYPPVLCNSCIIACGIPEISGTSGNGIYFINNIDLGSNLGAIVVKFTSVGAPDGIMVDFNDVRYNKLVSATYGVLQSALPDRPTYIGDEALSCAILNDGGLSTLNTYYYNGTSFSFASNIMTIDVNTSQVVLTAANPGECYMVIPRTDLSQNYMNIIAFVMCGETGFNVEFSCPAMLTARQRSIVYEEITEDFCSAPLTSSYFTVSVNNDEDYLNINDMVFQDAYGLTPLFDGWYRANTADLSIPNDSFYVENGIVTIIEDICD